MTPQWEWNHDHQGTPDMPLGDRIRQLRKQAGSSQAKIGTAPGRSSRYETGTITPSADALVKLAETFNVSCDYLLVDDAPHRPFKSPEDTLGEHLAQLAELTPHDQQLVISFIDALVTKTRLKTLANQVS